MGPFCKFCNERCFVLMPPGTPDYVLRDYFKVMGHPVDILATCNAGQEFERNATGWCYTRIMRIVGSGSVPVTCDPAEPKAIIASFRRAQSPVAKEKFTIEEIIAMGGYFEAQSLITAFIPAEEEGKLQPVFAPPGTIVYVCETNDESNMARIKFAYKRPLDPSGDQTGEQETVEIQNAITGVTELERAL